MEGFSRWQKGKEYPWAPCSPGRGVKHYQNLRYFSPLLFSEWASLPLRVSFCQTLWQNVSATPPSNGCGKRKMVLRLWSISTSRSSRLTIGEYWPQYLFRSRIWKGKEKVILQGREEEVSQRTRDSKQTKQQIFTLNRNLNRRIFAFYSLKMTSFPSFWLAAS